MGAKSNPDRHRIFKPGEIFGKKKILKFVYTLADKNYYDVENLCCGLVTRITQHVILKGRQCNECRKRGMAENVHLSIQDHKQQQRRFEW